MKKSSSSNNKKPAAGNGSAKARPSNQASSSDGFRPVFEDQLKDIYRAEKKLTIADSTLSSIAEASINEKAVAA